MKKEILIGAAAGFLNGLFGSGGGIAAALIYSTAVEPAMVSYLEESMQNSVDAESVIASVTGAVNDLPAISHLLFDFSKVFLICTLSVAPKHPKWVYSTKRKTPYFVEIQRFD